MDNNKNRDAGKLIRDKIVNILIAAVFLFVIFIDIRVTVMILMGVSIFFLNAKGAARGLFLGITLGILIALIVGVVAQDLALIIAVARYSIISGSIIGLYIGGLVASLFNGPSNKFLARTITKWRQNEQI